MIQVFVDSQDAYRIFKDDVLVFETVAAITPFNEVLQALRLDDGNVNIIEMYDVVITPPVPSPNDNIGGLEGMRQVLTDDTKLNDNNVDAEHIIAEMNANMANRHANRYRHVIETNSLNLELKSEDISAGELSVDSAPSNVPVGPVESPKPGDLIYIDGRTSVLDTIFGGVATVLAVHKTSTVVPNGNSSDIEDESSFIIDEYDDENDDEWWDTDFATSDYDEHKDDSMEANIMVELEEFPGTYFSWSMLRAKQNALQEKYGYKPACRI